MMQTLQTFQTTLTPNFHVLFNTSTHSSFRTQFLCISKPRDGNSDSESDPDPPKHEGDTQRPELLARIAMLQTSKVRLTDFLDERSDYLTKFAVEANAEFERPRRSKLKGLNKLETEENDNKLAEFEEKIVVDRNEGLFFKSLRDKMPVDAEKGKDETERTQEVTKESAGSMARRNLYLGLIGIVVLAIADSFISSPDWRKVAVLGAILIPLLTQFVYEQTLLSEETDKGNGNKKE